MKIGLFLRGSLEVGALGRESFGGGGVEEGAVGSFGPTHDGNLSLGVVAAVRDSLPALTLILGGEGTQETDGLHRQALGPHGGDRLFRTDRYGYAEIIGQAWPIRHLDN